MIMFLLFASITGLILSVTFTLVLCVGQSATDTEDASKRRAKRSTKREELFKHPIFVSQRQNLDVEEANCMTTKKSILEKDYNDTSKDSHSAKLATDWHSVSLPAIIKDREPSAINQMAETINDQPFHHVTINLENGLCSGNIIDAETKQQKVAASSLQNGKSEQSQNVALRKDKAVSCLEPIMLGPAVKNSHSRFSLTTNNAYGSSSRPNSVYDKDEFSTSNVHHEQEVSLEKNPSYLELPNDLSDPSDEEYSYVSTFNHKLIGKNSTWPHQTQQSDSTTALDVEAVGIYVDIDYTAVSEKQVTEEENFYI